jgi:hypothetical protein
MRQGLKPDELQVKAGDCPGRLGLSAQDRGLFVAVAQFVHGVVDFRQEASLDHCRHAIPHAGKLQPFFEITTFIGR